MLLAREWRVGLRTRRDRELHVPSENSEERVDVSTGRNELATSARTTAPFSADWEGRFTVYFLTAIGQRWKRAAGASLTIALLSAVAVVGLTVFGSKMMTACRAAGNAEQALASGSALGLLNLEAPEAKVKQFQAKTQESELAKNWKFTDSPLLDSILASNTPLDYALVTNPNTPQPIFGGLSLSFNQIATNPLLSPFANLIALSGADSFLGNFLSQVYLPIVDATLNALAKSLAVTNPVLAAFVTAVKNSINSTVVGIVNSLIASQNALNATIPPNFRPPSIKPASPT